MKRVPISLLFCRIALFAHDLPIIDDKFIYERIFKYPDISKETIYAAAKQHIGVNFRSATDVIKEERARVRIFDIHTSNISAYSGTTEKSLESIMFEKARSANRSRGKSKERRLKEFNVLSDLLNRTFYGHMDIFNESARQDASDD